MAALQLLVFDTRRGNKEGEENDKVLAGFPDTVSLLQQSSMAGLLQGLLLFTANFTTDPVGGSVMGERALMCGICTRTDAPSGRVLYSICSGTLLRLTVAPG
jgi:hypothetical protein